VASFRQWKDIEDIYRAVREAKPRLIHLVREIWLHDRAKDRSLCPCKCSSRHAHRVEIRQHLEVLIDRVTGVRRVRRGHNHAAFDRIAAKAERIDMPIRCYAEQLPAILDRKHKCITVNGGNRAGKSEVGKEATGDRWAEYGGKGVCLWWVAPTREMTQIAVDKLVRGERTNRFARPLFPRALVRYYPKTELVKPQRIVLIDGSKIELKYAGRLKGRSAIFINVDEACDVKDEANWTVIHGRTMDSGGQVMATTTPVAGHWLKKVVDIAIPYHALTDAMWADLAVQNVSLQLSCLRNPWIPLHEVERSIAAKGGPSDPEVRREFFGEWIASGNRMWRHWDPKRHMIEGIGDEPHDFGWINVTSIAIRHFAPRGARNDKVGGWDCNDFPQSLIHAYVAVADRADLGNPRKWAIMVTTEIVKKATIVKWGEFLAERAAIERGKPLSWIVGLVIVGDANTCYEDTRGPSNKGQGTDADVLRERGFVVVPPAWTESKPEKPAKPKNPSIRDRCKELHKLMHEDRLKIHGDCKKLLDAIESQTCDDRGLPLKVSGQASDRLSGPADALGYLVYRVFSGATEGLPEGDGKRFVWS
jgi:hypothetical protein